MKRVHSKSTRNKASEVRDIKRDVPPEQLAALGALALAYNATEAVVDQLFIAATELPDHLQVEVSTRINGIEGKLAIIKAGARGQLPDDDLSFLADALGKHGFERMKTYRDGVIHARHINVATGVGL